MEVQYNLYSWYSNSDSTNLNILHLLFKFEWVQEETHALFYIVFNYIFNQLQLYSVNLRTYNATVFLSNVSYLILHLKQQHFKAVSIVLEKIPGIKNESRSLERLSNALEMLNLQTTEVRWIQSCIYYFNLTSSKTNGTHDVSISSRALTQRFPLW